MYFLFIYNTFEFSYWFIISVFLHLFNSDISLAYIYIILFCS